MIFVKDQKDAIDYDVLSQYYSKMKGRPLEVKDIGPFESEEELKDFVFDMASDLNARVYLLRCEQYNQIIEKTMESEGILQSLRSEAEIIEDVENQGGRRLWNKIFPKSR